MAWGAANADLAAGVMVASECRFSGWGRGSEYSDMRTPFQTCFIQLRVVDVMAMIVRLSTPAIC